MSDYIVYHNPRCTKSRQALAYLDERNQSYHVVDYLKEPLSTETLKSVLVQLGMKPEELLRKGEVTFKEQFKGKSFSDDEWIQAMIDFPKLMERPIVVKNNKAVVARPTESIDNLG